MKKTLLHMLAVPVTLVLTLFIGSFFVETEDGTRPSLMQTATVIGLHGGAFLVNRDTPQQMDDATRMLRVEAGPGLRMTYVLELSAPGITPAALNAGALQDEMVHQACISEDTRTLVQKGVKLAFSFQDPHGRVLKEIVVAPSDCADKIV